MDPDRFQMKDLKRRVSTLERHDEKTIGLLRNLKGSIAELQEQLIALQRRK